MSSERAEEAMLMGLETVGSREELKNSNEEGLKENVKNGRAD